MMDNKEEEEEEGGKGEQARGDKKILFTKGG
jgi:hypothetical protein